MSELHLTGLPSHEFLSTLLRIDPQGYESLRSKLIKELIDGAPERMRPRLRGMQFRIDCERQLSKSTLGLTMRIYNLMWESFLELNDNLQDFISAEAKSSFTTPDSKLAESPFPKQEQCAQVIEFRPRPKGGNLKSEKPQHF